MVKVGLTVIRLGFEPRTHCVLVGAPIETSKHPQKEDACLFSDSAGVRTQAHCVLVGAHIYIKKSIFKQRVCF